MDSWMDIPVDARQAQGSRLWSLLRSLFILSAATLLTAGCAVQSQSVSAGSNLQHVPEEEPRVVECLLPSQVRQLGTQLTYLSARQVIKTSARDCEIRGGSQQGPSAKSSW